MVIFQQNIRAFSVIIILPTFVKKCLIIFQQNIRAFSVIIFLPTFVKKVSPSRTVGNVLVLSFPKRGRCGLWKKCHMSRSAICGQSISSHLNTRFRARGSAPWCQWPSRIGLSYGHWSGESGEPSTLILGCLVLEFTSHIAFGQVLYIDKDM